MRTRPVFPWTVTYIIEIISLILLLLICKKLSYLSRYHFFHYRTALRPANSVDQLAEKYKLDTSSLKEDSQSAHLQSNNQTLQASFRPLKTNTSGMLESLNSLPDNLPRKKKSSLFVVPGMDQFEGQARRISTVSEGPANAQMGKSVSLSSRMNTATYSGYPRSVFSENVSPLTKFLQSLDITEVVQKLLDEKMDIDSFLLCEKSDFYSIGLPLGPRKKLLAAIKVRRDSLTNPEKCKILLYSVALPIRTYTYNAQNHWQ